MSQTDYYTYFTLLKEKKIKVEAFLRLLSRPSDNRIPEESKYIEIKTFFALQKKDSKGKRNERFESLIRSIAAFASNERGSTNFVILGIRDKNPEKHKFTNQERETLEELRNRPENYTNPPVSIDEPIFRRYVGGEVIIIRVAGTGRPHQCKLDHEYYIRNEQGESVRIPAEAAQRLMQQPESDEQIAQLRGEIVSLKHQMQQMTELYSDALSQQVVKQIKANPEKARKEAEKKKDFAKEAVALLLLARKRLDQGNLAEAKTLFNQATQLARKAKKRDIAAVAVAELAYLVYARAGEMDKAEETMKRAFAAAGRKTEQMPQLFFYRGNLRHKKGDLDAAIADYAKATELAPRHAEAFNNRGIARGRNGDLDGAIADFDRTIELNPNGALAFYNRGIARGKKGDLDGAIADYNQAIELNQNHAEAFINRGVARGEKGDLDGEIADYNKAIELNPKDAEAFYNRGVARGKKGDVDGAIADFDKAIELNPRHAAAFNNRGIAKGKKDALDGAIADFDKAIELNPNGAEAFNNRGIARGKKGDLDGEIADYNKAIELNPDCAPTFNNRGIAKRKKSDLDGAIADFNKAVELGLKSPMVFLNRGLAYLQLEKYEEAQKDAKGAQGADKSSPYGPLLNILALFSARQYDEAEKQVELLKDVMPLYSVLKQAMERWREIEETLHSLVLRFETDTRIKGALIYGGAAEWWRRPERLLRPAVRDIDMYVIVDGFADKDEAYLTVTRMRDLRAFPMDITVLDVKTWEAIKTQDLFTRQEVLPKMKVIYGKV